MAKKTNYSYVGISFIILVFGIWFVPKIVERFSNNDVIRNESRTESISAMDADTENETQPLAYLEINGERKKVPEFEFTNQNGDLVSHETYLGKVYVVEFFFTTCPTICPKMNYNLVQVQEHFKDQEDYGVASFTITPETDTPEVLKAYAEKYGITNPNWHFMTGDREAIYKLANEGFNLYTAEDAEVEGGFEHSGNFALIDKEGYIRCRVNEFGSPMIYYNGIVSEAEGVDDEGIPQEITMLKEDIAKLLKE
jgi:protein SCO1/2